MKKTSFCAFSPFKIGLFAFLILFYVKTSAQIDDYHFARIVLSGGLTSFQMNSSHIEMNFDVQKATGLTHASANFITQRVPVVWGGQVDISARLTDKYHLLGHGFFGFGLRSGIAGLYGGLGAAYYRHFIRTNDLTPVLSAGLDIVVSQSYGPDIGYINNTGNNTYINGKHFTYSNIDVRMDCFQMGLAPRFGVVVPILEDMLDVGVTVCYFMPFYSHTTVSFQDMYSDHTLVKNGTTTGFSSNDPYLHLTIDGHTGKQSPSTGQGFQMMLEVGMRFSDF